MKIIRTEARGPAKNGEDCGPDRRSWSDRGNTAWNELRNKTVPRPLVPLDGKCTGVLTTMGGVTAGSIPVVEDRRREREEPSRIPEGRVIVRGVKTTCYQGELYSWSLYTCAKL